MAGGSQELLKLIDVALGIAQDKAFRETLIRVQSAQCPPSRIDGQKETRYNGKEGRQRR